MAGWLLFLINAAIFFLVLYLPGLLFACALRPKLDLLQISVIPLSGFALYSLIGMALYFLNISVDVLQLFLITASISLLLLLITRLLGRKTTIGLTIQEIRMLALYAVVGFGIASLFFVKCMDGAFSFNQAHDNVTHLNLIHFFMNSGEYTQFSNIYNLLPEGVASCTGSQHLGGFYPSGWHIVAAVAGGLSSHSAAMAETSSLFMLIGFSLPVSVLVFLQRIFPDRPNLLLLGSAFTLAFAAFPWNIITCNGPLFPYAVACLFIPSVTSFITDFFYRHDQQSDVLLHRACLFFVSILGMVLVHPSSVFSLGVFTLPFLFKTVVERFKTVKRNRLLVSVSFFIFVTIIWVFFYKLPFLQGTVGFYWPKEVGFIQAIVNGLDFSLAGSSMAQPLIALFFLVGVAYSLRDKESTWLVTSYILGLTLFVIAKGTDWSVKSLLTGFWYTDGNRLSAICVFSALPLVVLGCYHVIQFTCDKLMNLYCFNSLTRKSIILSLVAISAILVFGGNIAVYGYFDVTSAFGNISTVQTEKYSLTGSNFYSGEEQQFVEKVKKTVKSTDLILNNPEDGSFFCASVSDLNVYYRTPHVGEHNDDTKQSQLIRKSLYKISFDPAVKNAVSDLNAKYVLVLGQGGERDDLHPYYLYYQPNTWRGINKITDSTPGFTVVLSQGDNRLYRIDY